MRTRNIHKYKLRLRICESYIMRNKMRFKIYKRFHNAL